jgi:two-component system heavy metal sensor histidine kinase CusS
VKRSTITNSFRLKIALFSALITGGLLIAAGIAFWQLTYSMDLARIDREIRNLGTPNLERVFGGDHWVRFESSLGFVSGTNTNPSFILWVKNDNRIAHKSAHWPPEIEPEAFPAPSKYENGNAPAPGQPPPPPPRREEQISPRNPALPRMAPQFYTRDGGGRTWRIGVMGTPYSTLIIGADLKEFTSGMRQLRNAYLTALPVVLLLVAAGAWFIASRALRPVTALTQTVEGITAQGLSQRLPTGAHEIEFERLIGVFNQMMERLESSFHQATRFSADASHELKTPLTILQGEIESALQRAPAGSDQQRVFSGMLDEIQRLKSITHKLLLLSLADSGQLKLSLVPLNLSEAVTEICEDAAVLGPNLKLHQNITADLQVLADRDLLGQVLQNLTTNAIKYNFADGFVLFELKREHDQVVFRISNSGTPIPAGEQEKIFHRFYRGASSERKIEGVGLGLSLSREIARAHQGELRLEQSTPAGTAFVLTLPAR